MAEEGLTLGKILLSVLGVVFFLIPEGASSLTGIGIIAYVWGFDILEEL